MSRRGAAVHELIAWLSGAIKSGLLDDLPPYSPEPGRLPLPAGEFAARLLADLTGPPTSPEPIGLVEARAFPFRIWAESQLGDISRRPSVRRSGTRLASDPARRGVDIGRSLRTIAKNVAATPPPDELTDHAQVSPGAAGSAQSLWMLALLFVLPLAIILGMEAAYRWPLALVCTVGAIAAFALLGAAARAVREATDRPGSGNQDWESPSR